MSMVITDDCINCGACAVECPTEAISESGENRKVDGRSFAPLSMDHFFIVTDFCNECAGLSKIRCIAVCPMDAIKNYF